MMLDHAAVFTAIQQHLHSAAPISERMGVVIAACERTLPHPDWTLLRALPYDDVADMRDWLFIVFEGEAPELRLAGLWFGLFHPVLAEGPSVAIRLGGSSRFTDDGELDWASGLEYRPVNRRQFSTILRAIHRIAYGRDRTMPAGESRWLASAAVWALCLAYGAFAIQRLLPNVLTDLATRDGPIVVAVGWDGGDFVILGRLTADGWVPHH